MIVSGISDITARMQSVFASNKKSTGARTALQSVNGSACTGQGIVSKKKKKVDEITGVIVRHVRNTPGHTGVNTLSK